MTMYDYIKSGPVPQSLYNAVFIASALCKRRRSTVITANALFLHMTFGVRRFASASASARISQRPCPCPRSQQLHILVRGRIALSNEPKVTTVRRRYPPPSPQKRGRGNSKTQNGLFPCKIALSLMKVRYKVSWCEKC